MSQSIDQHVPGIDGDETENDTGYSSYDSSTSCPHEEGSEKSWILPVSNELGSHGDSPVNLMSQWCDNEDDSMQGVDEVDDLLFNFERFFQERLEHHIQEFSSSMQSMFSEQQVHVRQIVHSVCSGDNNPDTDLIPEIEGQDGLEPTSSGTDPKIDIEARPTDVRSPLLIELLSLSCELSSLLRQDKYGY